MEKLKMILQSWIDEIEGEKSGKSDGK